MRIQELYQWNVFFVVSQTANCAHEHYTTAQKMEPRSGLKAAAGTSIQAIFSLACCSQKLMKFVGVKQHIAPIPRSNQENLLFYKL